MCAFLVIAIALIVWATHLSRDEAPTVLASESRAPDGATKAAPDAASSLDELIGLLGSAGMRREALGLLAAKGALGDIKPIHLVGLALLAGFVVGRSR